MNFSRIISIIEAFFTELFAPKPFIVVAIGDSTVEGLGASHPDKTFAAIVHAAIKDQKASTEFYNLGKAGAKLGDVIKYQLNPAIKLKPDLVLISIGTNDVVNPTNTFRFAKNYEKLVQTIARKTSALMVVNNIPDFSITPKVPRSVVPWFNFLARRFNRIISACAVKTEAVLIDLYAQSHLFKNRRELIADDGFHPSDLGYALWGNIILSALSPHLK